MTAILIALYLFIGIILLIGVVALAFYWYGKKQGSKRIKLIAAIPLTICGAFVVGSIIYPLLPSQVFFWFIQALTWLGIVT
jgi:4-amino-4-deoxy-L-arabinose transferase-like glycosyltransferase